MNDVVPDSPSSLSSDNSDIDAVNTSSAKIYFGQFQSPERKLAALVDEALGGLDPNEQRVKPPEPPAPRRSPRLSKSPEPIVAEHEPIEQSDQEEEEDAVTENRRRDVRGGSWQDAPFPDFLRKDEPSSAIASRIMRAHDNPSPPPKALRPSLTPRSSNLSRELRFPSTSSSAESSDAAVESLLQLNNGNESTPTPPTFNLFDMPNPTIERGPSPPAPSQPRTSPSHYSQADTETDLISFDRSVIMTPASNEIEIRSPLPQHAQQQTVDDLLFSSPLQLASSESEPIGIANEPPQTYSNGDAVKTTTESQAQIHRDPLAPSAEPRAGEQEHDEGECLDSALDRTSHTLGSEHSSHDERNHNEHLSTPVARLPVPGPSSSPRRSPRLSAIPLPSPQIQSSPSNRSRTPKAESLTPEGSQIRKRRRDSPTKASRMSLTPKKHQWTIDCDGSGSESGALETPSKTGRKSRKRVKKCLEEASVSSQLAQSLSPSSADILTSLLSVDQLASEPQENMSAGTLTQGEFGTPTVADNTLSQFSYIPSSANSSSNVQRPPPGFFSSHTLTPARGTSTSRPFLLPNSPVKVTLTPAPIDDPNRTPARRIPIKEMNETARPNGTYFAPTISRTPVFTRPPPPANSPSRSPAKRPDSEFPHNESTSNTEGIAPSRTAADVKRSRSLSVEPSTRTELNGRKVVAPSDAGPTNGPSAMSLLPGPSSKHTFAAPKKSTSTMKTASTTESRIPRPGATTKSSLPTRTSKLPMPSTKRPHGSTPLVSRLPSPAKMPTTKVVRMHNSASSSSDESVGKTHAPRPGPSRLPANGSTAKRKRDAEKADPKPQMMKMRQVVPGMYGGPVRTVPQNPAEKAQPEQAPPSSPIKANMPSRPIRAREVVKGTLQDFELRTSSFRDLEALSEARARERAEQENATKEEEREPSPPAPAFHSFTFECPASKLKDDRMDVDSETGDLQTSECLPPSEDNVDAQQLFQPDGPLSAASAARRSTRSRRPVSTDLFGAVSRIGGPIQSNSLRRRATTGQPKQRASSLPPNLVFHSNGLALKTLTNSNTTRNQNYHTQLEMHIIRKAGERPESPTMKLRSILEKQKEDQDKMRAERAMRRRGQSDMSEESRDIVMDEPLETEPLKHRRGPGDEEDYETPVRPNNGRKAVKWDRGLEASVFLDEIEVRPERHRAGQGTPAPRKGCLSVFPDRAPLDSLGNPLNADSPLNLEPQKVVVTKYIYDNDEEATVFDPPPPKITRSKAKKK